MALHSLYCADVPLRNCSLTHTLQVPGRNKSSHFLRTGYATRCDDRRWHKRVIASGHCTRLDCARRKNAHIVP